MTSVVKHLFSSILILNLLAACTHETQNGSNERLVEDMFVRTTQLADPVILEDAEIHLREATEFWLKGDSKETVIHLAKAIADMKVATNHSEGELRTARDLMLAELETIKAGVVTGELEDPELIFGPYQEAIILSGEILGFGFSARN